MIGVVRSCQDVLGVVWSLQELTGVERGCQEVKWVVRSGNGLSGVESGFQELLGVVRVFQDPGVARMTTLANSCQLPAHSVNS